MGRYINQDSQGNQLPATGKTLALVLDGARLMKAKVFGPNVVCVVDNGGFEAAAYCYSQREFEAFDDPYDDRPKTWLTYEHADRLSDPKQVPARPS